MKTKGASMKTFFGKIEWWWFVWAFFSACWAGIAFWLFDWSEALAWLLLTFFMVLEAMRK